MLLNFLNVVWKMIFKNVWEPCIL